MALPPRTDVTVIGAGDPLGNGARVAGSGREAIRFSDGLSGSHPDGCWRG